LIFFDDSYQEVFGGEGRLYTYELKNAEELRFKTGENNYFSVINIR